MDLRKLQIGKKIKRLRELKNLTQSQMAEKIGITQGAYSKIEMGETEVTYSRLESISTAFDMKPEDVIAFNDNLVFNVSNNPNGGNVFGSITYTTTDLERKLYEDQIHSLKEENSFLKKMLEKLMEGK
jgi:transcriptional regulator with XRE-family HTH domain